MQDLRKVSHSKMDCRETLVEIRIGDPLSIAVVRGKDCWEIPVNIIMAIPGRALGLRSVLPKKRHCNDTISASCFQSNWFFQQHSPNRNHITGCKNLC